MKNLKTSLLALSLLAALPLQAAETAAVPAAIAQHQGPVRIAVIRNLGSDDNTTQFLAGAIQEGRKLGFKVDTFLSNGDDARFQDFVNQAISQKYDGIILSQGRAPIPPTWSNASRRPASPSRLSIPTSAAAFPASPSRSRTTLRWPTPPSASW